MLALAAASLISSTAIAADPSRDTPLPGLNFGLPGIRRVGFAGSENRGASFSAGAGYGFTESAAGADAGHRIAAAFAASLAPTSWLGFGLMFDGRLDARGGDGGWTGDPRLAIRAGSKVSRTFALAGQATVWIPGGEDPGSLAFGATSFDLALLATYAPRRSAITLGFNAGFRVNQSDKAFENAALLSVNDRASLGLSASNAILLGAGAIYAMKSVELLAEATWDLQIGDSSPGAFASPLRLDAGARFALDRERTLGLAILAEALLSSRPDATDPLSPIEPRVGIVAALSFTLPFAKGAAHADVEELAEVETPPETSAPEPEPAKPAPPPPEPAKPVATTVQPPPPPAQSTATTGGVKGEVRSIDGKPIAGAKVLVGRPATVVRTTGNGTFEVTELSPGDTQVTIEHESFVSRTITVIIKVGTNADVSLTLEPKPGPGTLRGLVEVFGRGAVAKIEIEPGHKVIESDEEGSFKIELDPGTYTVTITAPAMAPFEKEIQIVSKSTTTLNAELKKKK